MLWAGVYIEEYQSPRRDCPEFAHIPIIWLVGRLQDLRPEAMSFSLNFDMLAVRLRPTSALILPIRFQSVAWDSSNLVATRCPDSLITPGRLLTAARRARGVR